ncbi:MAG: hypothetical protein ABIT05_12425 [Chitinophagaceae bacterium]
MKRLLFAQPIIILILFFLPGCSKDNGSSSSYINGKIDGLPFSCTTNLWATDGRAGDKIIAIRSQSPNYFLLYLSGGSADINPGVYDFAPGPNERSAVFYENNVGYSAGQFSCYYGTCPFYGSGKITIRAINKKHVEGSFEFVTDVNASTGVSKTVTEGDFNVTRD